MPPKKSAIPISDIGDAVNHIAAGFGFLNREKFVKHVFRLTLIVFVSGTAIGIRQCSMKETIEVKEFLPSGTTGSLNYPFLLYAQSKQSELFRTEKGELYGWGRKIGSIDTNVEIFKVEINKEWKLVYIDKQRNKIHLIAIPESVSK